MAISCECTCGFRLVIDEHSIYPVDAVEALRSAEEQLAETIVSGHRAHEWFLSSEAGTPSVHVVTVGGWVAPVQ